VQLRFQTELTFEQYRTQRGWETATLSACPLCAPGDCHFHRLGTYMRKVPAVALVARYACPEQHVTFGLLPDFYASRMPGTLDMIEEVAAKAETASSLQKAADEVRPADASDAVTLGAALVWVRLRVLLARATLSTVKGLMPDRFAEVPPRVSAQMPRWSWNAAAPAHNLLVQTHHADAGSPRIAPRLWGASPRRAP
jgi:hypothetical protein